MKTKIPQGNWSQEIKEMETVPNVFIHSNVWSNDSIFSDLSS